MFPVEPETSRIWKSRMSERPDRSKNSSAQTAVNTRMRALSSSKQPLVGMIPGGFLGPLPLSPDSSFKNSIINRFIFAFKGDKPSVCNPGRIDSKACRASLDYAKLLRKTPLCLVRSQSRRLMGESPLGKA